MTPAGAKHALLSELDAMNCAADTDAVTAVLATKATAIQRALARLAEGTWGTCLDCAEPIAEKRLQAMPWVERCVGCQAALEHEARAGRSEPSVRIPRAPLTPDELTEIQVRHDDEGEPFEEIARDLGCAEKTIRRAAKQGRRKVAR